jgi:hypothetical protein
LRPCAVLVVGVSGSLPIHGIGTANFIVRDSNGNERIWRIHNCLLSHRSDGDVRRQNPPASGHVFDWLNLLDTTHEKRVRIGFICFFSI